MFGNELFREEVTPARNALNQNLFEDQQQQLEGEVRSQTLALPDPCPAPRRAQGWACERGRARGWPRAVAPASSARCRVCRRGPEAQHAGPAHGGGGANVRLRLCGGVCAGRSAWPLKKP
jgi:hypothetical protein